MGWIGSLDVIRMKTVMIEMGEKLIGKKRSGFVV